MTIAINVEPQEIEDAFANLIAGGRIGSNEVARITAIDDPQLRTEAQLEWILDFANR